MDKNFKLKEKDIWEAENIFYLKSDFSRLSKFIYHYEIYKKIINIPGSILEFGVFKGASFSRFLSFRKILENENSREIIGFDDFGLFTSKGSKDDKAFAKKFIREVGPGINKTNLENILHGNNHTNFKLIKGDVIKTLPEYLKNNKQLKISLLHLDLDIFRPTYFVLKKLYQKVVKGGLILIDDYAEINGATKAIDDFFKDQNIKIEKLPLYKRPSFIIKK
tara:strand:- start:11988 stop:12650 length:663 start_codon:yes stop_codon:yes gene_type:complete